MSGRRLILVCNAHLDPVWLWEWQEGLAETLTTFRTAARLCEEYEEFVFCHNEAVLYQWVEQYEPQLFRRIQKLVGQGRWHILGGWVLQPDCNLPCGESFVRQALVGKTYFKEKFGVEPRTAVNFDPFGHTRGLVQILTKAGYDSYLFCRPDPSDFNLPAEDFYWEGYDGSRILAHRAPEHYNSEPGQAAAKAKAWLKKYPEAELGMLLWGIGDHGGGPSREDLSALRSLMADETSCRIKHGTPEEYFEGLSSRREKIPVFSRDLNPWAVGCYTTMSLVKTLHRRLENLFLSTEKTAAHAWLAGLMDYPKQDLDEALSDLLYCQFHDILPGSSIAEVETQAVQRLDHGLEILDRVRSRAFFSLLSGQPPAEKEEFPVLVYNPHPFVMRTTLHCEFQPLWPNHDPEKFWLPEMRDAKGNTVICQLERESSNIAVDQRKRVSFRAELEPWEMKRYGVRLVEGEPPEREPVPVGEKLEVPLAGGSLCLDPVTGLVCGYSRDGQEFLEQRACELLVLNDYPDPWGMKVRSFRDVAGRFELMTPEEAAAYSGSPLKELHPVRIVEDGPVRLVVEALFHYERSYACVHYTIPRQEEGFGMTIRVYWNEKDRMLKLAVPTALGEGPCLGQVAYGVEKFDRRGEELVAQKWAAVLSEDRSLALSVVNDRTYGFDVQGGEMRFSLLRSAAYAAHPVADDIPIVPHDRFIPRIDQGERVFRFWISGGRAPDRLARVEREASARNEPPFTLCCYPTGEGAQAQPAVLVDNPALQLTALKVAEDGRRLIVRLFETSGKIQRIRLQLPALDLIHDLEFGPFELKTLAVDPAAREIRETDLLEHPDE
jgi:alpha-mannosidase